MINLAVYRTLAAHLSLCNCVITDLSDQRAIYEGRGMVHQWRFCWTLTITYKSIYRLTIYQLVTIIIIIIITTTTIITTTVTVTISRIVFSD